MSSLSATQADGYYIPPEYIDSGTYKKKSLNQYQHSQSSKSNSGKGKVGHNQYLTNNVVRFEFPYDGFCLNPSCGAHVGKGTRFNAHKAHVDDYFTTKIWEFTMTCRICASKEYKFVIRTNPQDRCFDYVSGIKKKCEEFDTKEAGTYGVIDTEYGNGIVGHTSVQSKETAAAGTPDNPLDRLEKEIAGKRKAMTDRDAMDFLLQHNKQTMLDDATSNSKLRATYRVGRKAKKRRLKEAADVGLGKGIELYEATKEDVGKAKEVFEGVKEDRVKKKSYSMEKDRFRSLRGGSIFSSSQDVSTGKKGSKKKGSKSFRGDKKTTVVTSTDSSKTIIDGKAVVPSASTTSESMQPNKKERLHIKTTPGSLIVSTPHRVIRRLEESEDPNSSLLALQSYSSDSD